MLVAGSIFWILPGPAERKKMALRQRANALGFKVKLVSSSEIAEKFGLSLVEAGLCYYFKSGIFQHAGMQWDQSAVLIAFASGEAKFKVVLCRPAAQPATINHAKVVARKYDGVKCVFVSDREFGVLWNERESESQLGAMLEDLQETFAGH